MRRTLQGAAVTDDVDFVPAEGMTQLEALFEEEFKADEKHTTIVGGSSSSVSLSCNSMTGFNPAELTEDPINYAPSHVTEMQ